MDFKNLPWITETDENAVKHAIEHLPDNPIIFEAGVCGAEDTVKFKEIWPNSTIYGFEPHPETFKTAKNKIEQFNLKNVNLQQKALGKNVEIKKFYMSNINAGTSSFFEDNLSNIDYPEEILKKINSPKEIKKTYEDVGIQVECTTIDAFCKENNINHIDYIWLDTEGAEYDILSSAKNMLKTVKVISTELNFMEFRKGMAQFEDTYNLLIQNEFTLKCIWSFWGMATWQAVGVFIKL